MIHLGLMSNIYDGIQRPLKVSKRKSKWSCNNPSNVLFSPLFIRPFKMSQTVSIFPVVSPPLPWISNVPGTLSLSTLRYTMDFLSNLASSHTYIGGRSHHWWWYLWYGGRELSLVRSRYYASSQCTWYHFLPCPQGPIYRWCKQAEWGYHHHHPGCVFIHWVFYNRMLSLKLNSRVKLQSTPWSNFGLCVLLVLLPRSFLPTTPCSLANVCWILFSRKWSLYSILHIWLMMCSL